jgi:hypothetical protein
MESTSHDMAPSRGASLGGVSTTKGLAVTKSWNGVCHSERGPPKAVSGWTGKTCVQAGEGGENVRTNQRPQGGGRKRRHGSGREYPVNSSQPQSVGRKGGGNDGGPCYEVINHPAAAPPACTTHTRRSISRPNCFRMWCTPPTPQHSIRLSFIEVPIPPDDDGIRIGIFSRSCISSSRKRLRFPLRSGREIYRDKDNGRCVVATTSAHADTSPTRVEHADDPRM